ncbi:MAG: two-component system, OmpR family, response regulator MprA [Thermoleophilaceae bacterium]|jgi:two-component system response regulator MprA|nr:two-component system, OmpR family, response regulator MprA [Thermoleophilaceae bacterium]
MRALVIDDDRALREALRRALTLAGYEVQLAEDGYAGLAKVAESHPDVIVLDVLMPEIDGLEVCRRLRADGDRTPILMLTARDAVEDRIEGLDAGADDYLVKPFDVDEVKARLRALLRRGGGQAGGEHLRFGAVELDADNHGARVGDKLVELTRTEYQLLELLMLNPRRVLPHSMIYERVWGYDFGPTSNALRVYIGYLRRKLAQLGVGETIRNVRGVGYALQEAES